MDRTYENTTNVWDEGELEIMYDMANVRTRIACYQNDHPEIVVNSSLIRMRTVTEYMEVGR